MLLSRWRALWRRQGLREFETRKSPLAIHLTSTPALNLLLRRQTLELTLNVDVRVAK